MGRGRVEARPRKWDADVRRVQAILKGDDRAWHALVYEYADRMVTTALRWCRPGCLRRQPCAFSGGAFSRPFEVYKRQDCENLSDAFDFIVCRIRQKCLEEYEGRCALSTFLFPLFVPRRERKPGSPGLRYGYEQLLSDFLRQEDRRIRAPKAVQELGEFESGVYVQTCYGRDQEEIAFHLGLTPEQRRLIPGARERIDEVLRDEGSGHYWGFMGYLSVEGTVTFSELDGEDDERLSADERIASTFDTERAAIALADGDAISPEALKSALKRLSTTDQGVLRYALGDMLTARQIAPRLGVDARRVYTLLTSALRSLNAALEDQGTPFSGDLGEALMVFWEPRFARNRRPSEEDDR